MSKYNFDLDMNSDNSNSVILRNIKPNSKILEVGSAHGRMTKYLKDNLNCDVTIVEKDYDSGKVAAKWASKFYIDSVFGDIETCKSIFDLKHKNEKFQYIIFADVLEHLHNPKMILENIKPIMADDGSIWVSIPNVAHNSILIDLWNNKFEYRDIGLLDSTHIKFFTESSLRTMIEDTGFITVNEINLTNKVGCTEFNNDYSDVPDEIVDALKNRQFADIYQFVWELKVK